MTNFHVSDDGNPRICKAQAGNCPIAADSEHFETSFAARDHYEKKHSNQISSITASSQMMGSSSSIENTGKRLIDGNWTKGAHHAAGLNAQDMTRKDVQAHTLSMISHNMHPAIGMFRLVADSGDQAKIEKSLKNKDNYADTAAESIADKLEGNREENIKFLTESIHEAFDPIFEEYSKDVYADVDLDLALDNFAIKVADYSNKK